MAVWLSSLRRNVIIIATWTQFVKYDYAIVRFLERLKGIPQIVRVGAIRVRFSQK